MPRERMIKLLREQYKIRDENVLQAMTKVSRHLFVPDALKSHLKRREIKCSLRTRCKQEAIGRNCRFLQGAGTDPAAVLELRAALAAGKDATVVLLNYRKDGTPFWNQVALSPVRDDTAQLTHFVGAQTDVTKRVEADQRLTLLAEVTSLLAVTLDLDEAMDRLTHLIVPQLADGMVVTLTAPMGAPVGTFAQHRDKNTDLLGHLVERLQGAADAT